MGIVFYFLFVNNKINIDLSPWYNVYLLKLSLFVMVFWLNKLFKKFKTLNDSNNKTS